MATQSNLLNVSELDMFFMSYDEPNALENFTALKTIAPWAKHMQGIKGFDAVHRACAARSGTSWFVTVDADTILYPSFLDVSVDLSQFSERNFCWSSRNTLNGLTYGNGGVKVWYKPFAQAMAFHEHGVGVDFCWDPDYRSMGKVYSDVTVTGSAYQAFRAGYREGVKLTLNRGRWIDPSQWLDLHPENIRNVSIWASVGADVENGIWAILGARAGLADNLDQKVTNQQVGDYTYLEQTYQRYKSMDYQQIVKEIDTLGDRVSVRAGLNIPFFNVEQSRFIRSHYGR